MTTQSPLPPLDVLDEDGAIREALDKTKGDTRATFLRKAAIGGGALLSSGAIMGAMPALANARGSYSRDLSILNFALTLEYLEAAFYVRAVKQGNLRGEAAKFARVVRDHETTHVRALKATIQKLGGTPVKSPKFNFRDTTRDQRKFVATAIALEDTGVRAYLGQTPRIHLGPVLAAAASIATVEARHASWIRNIAGQEPAPLAFDTHWGADSVLKQVKATGFIVG